MSGAHPLRRLTRESSPGWGIVSQIVSSAGNLALAVLVARATTPAEFGAWSVAFLVFVIALGLNRACTGTPILLVKENVATRRDTRGSMTMAAGIGVVSAAILGAIGLLMPALRPSAWALAAGLPLILPLDTARNIYFQRLKNRSATVLDVLWVVGQALASAFLLARHATGPVPFTLAWGVAALPPLALAVWRLPAPPSLRDAGAFIGAYRDQMGRLAVEQTMMSARVQATPVAVAAAAGYSAAGYLRAGLTIMGGLNALILGLTPVGTVYMVKQMRIGARPTRLVNLWSAVMIAFAIVNGAVLLAIPTRLGEQILGSNWYGARAVLVPLIIHSLLRGPISGVPIALKAMGRLDLTVRLRFRAEPTALAFPVIAAIIWGAYGAAWGYVAGGAVTAAQSLLMLRKAVKQQGPADAIEQDPDSRPPSPTDGL